MRKLAIVSSIMLVALSLSPLVPQHAQNMTAQTGEAEHSRHSLAINLLRGINTAEAEYQGRHGGAYAPWEILVTSEEFTGRGMKWAAQLDPQLANAHFAAAPEILPGWRLRLNVTAGGKGYDLLLEDAIDTKCGYAALTDERGVIRQSKPLGVMDCPI